MLLQMYNRFESIEIEFRIGGKVSNINSRVRRGVVTGL